MCIGLASEFEATRRVANGSAGNLDWGAMRQRCFELNRRTRQLSNEFFFFVVMSIVCNSCYSYLTFQSLPVAIRPVGATNGTLGLMHGVLLCTKNLAVTLTRGRIESLPGTLGHKTQNLMNFASIM